MTRQEFVEHDAERVNVGGGGDDVTANLFRTGVVRRERSGRGDGHIRHLLRRVGREDLGDTEIQQFRVAVFGNENVVRFEVAVNDEMLMGILDGVANSLEELRRSTTVNRSSLQYRMRGRPMMYSMTR